MDRLVQRKRNTGRKGEVVDEREEKKQGERKSRTAKELADTPTNRE